MDKGEVSNLNCKVKENAGQVDEASNTKHDVEPLSLSKAMSCPQLNSIPTKRLLAKRKEKRSDKDNNEETDLFLSQGGKSLHSYVDDSVRNAKDSINHAIGQVDKFAHKVWDGRWRVVSYFQLQDWQKDNEFLHNWHRPAMPSFLHVSGPSSVCIPKLEIFGRIFSVSFSSWASVFTSCAYPPLSLSAHGRRRLCSSSSF